MRFRHRDKGLLALALVLILSLLLVETKGEEDGDYYDKIRPCPENYPHYIGDTCYHIGPADELYNSPKSFAGCHHIRGVPASPRQVHDIGNLTLLAKEGFSGSGILFWTGFTAAAQGQLLDPFGSWMRPRSAETAAMFDEGFEGLRPGMPKQVHAFNAGHGHSTLYVDTDGQLVISSNDLASSGRLVCEYVGAQCPDPEIRYSLGQCLWPVEGVRNNLAAGAVAKCREGSVFPDLAPALPLAGADRAIAPAIHNALRAGFEDHQNVVSGMLNYKPNCGQGYEYFMGRCYLVDGTLRYGRDVHDDLCSRSGAEDGQLIGADGGVDLIDAFYLRGYAGRIDGKNSDETYAVWSKPFGNEDAPPENCMARIYPDVGGADIFTWWNLRPELDALGTAVVDDYDNIAIPLNEQHQDIDVRCDEETKFELVCNIPLHMASIGITPKRFHGLKDQFTGTADGAWPSCISINKWFINRNGVDIVTALTDEAENHHVYRRRAVATVEQCARIARDRAETKDKDYVWTYDTAAATCYA